MTGAQKHKKPRRSTFIYQFVKNAQFENFKCFFHAFWKKLSTYDFPIKSDFCSYTRFYPHYPQKIQSKKIIFREKKRKKVLVKFYKIYQKRKKNKKSIDKTNVK